MKSYKTLLCYLILLIIISLFSYDSYFKNKFEKEYKLNGNYTIGKVIETKVFGRGSGHDLIYEFEANNKHIKSSNVASGKFNEAQKHIGNKYLVIYLKNNIRNNRIYTEIPIPDSIQSKNLKNWIKNSIDIKDKIDKIPSSGFFWETSETK